ncbi:hypothetical protein, partial [Mycobacterium tuberculosis]|uniref:hypothetical protein n=1 Tax=Mycobacterium tuberculosis TaxID=1773 RepID=UPI002551C792
AISHLKLQKSEPFLILILDDHDIKRNFELVCLEKSYSGISVESQKRLSSFGSVLSIASKVSNDCCNKVFHKKFPCLMKLLGVSMNKS